MRPSLFTPSKFLPITAFAVLAGLLFSASISLAQDHLIGEDQTVNRVIKLRSNSVPLPTPKADTDLQTSRSVQAKPTATTNPTAGVPLVQFDEIKPGSVPSVLQSASSVLQRTSEKPVGQAWPAVIPADRPNTNFIPSYSGTTNSGQPKVSQSWKGAPTVTPHPAEKPPTFSTEPVSITNSAPTINTLIEAPGYINLNQTATLRIKLQNVGNTSARQVKLIATLPAHAKFSRATPSPTRSEGQVQEFLLTDVAANQVREVAIDLIPTEKLPLDIGTEVVIENTQRFAVGVREPKLKLKIDGPTQANMGQELIHKVVIENTGDGIAEEIRLKIKFPKEIQPDKENGEIIIPSLDPGRSIVVDFPSRAQTPGKTRLDVTASATGIEAQSADSNITIYQPELEVSAEGPQMNFVDREGTYTIKLKNLGEVDVSKVTIMLQVPAGMQVTTISQEAAVDAESGVLVWSFDKIVAKTEQLIQLKTLAITEGQQVCNISVRSNETKEKEIRLTTLVATRADLNVSILNQTGPVQVGNPAQFIVIVENKGSSSAKDVTISIELPDSLKAVNQPGAEVKEFGNTITFRDAQIEPGQKREFAFSTAGVVKGEHVVRSILQTAGSERKIIVEGSVYVYEINESRVSESLSPVIPRR